MQSNMQTTSGIPCKVQYGNEYRSFLYHQSAQDVPFFAQIKRLFGFSETEEVVLKDKNENTQFASLLAQIKRLFVFSETEDVILEYKDKDGDMVTVSSDEELVFAIELFTGAVLKLNVIKAKNTHKRPRQRGQKGDKKGRPQRNGELWRERWHQNLQANPELLAQKIDKLTQKRDQLRNSLDSNKQNGPRPHNRWNPEKKLEQIETRLANLQSLSAKQSNPSSEPSQCLNPGSVEQTVVVANPPTTLPLCADELSANLTKAKDLREQQVKLDQKENSPTNLQSNLSSEPSQCLNPGSVEQNVVVAIPPTTQPLSADELAANLTKAKDLREQHFQALEDVKKKMQAKKQEIQQMRAQAKAESIPKNEMQQRVAPLNEELKTIRETLQQRKAELQACNQNICAVRKALKEKQNA